MFIQVLTGALAFIGGMAVLLTVLTVIWIEGFGKAGRRGGRTGAYPSTALRSPSPCQGRSGRRTRG